MKKVESVVISIQKSLQLLGDQTRAEAKNKYLKNIIKHRGISNPNTYVAIKEEMKKNYFIELDYTQRMRVAEELLKSEYGEDKLASITIYENLHKNFTESDIDSIKQIIKEGHIQEWASCDTLSRPIRDWSLISEKNTRYIAEWSKEQECLWVRRCCCVSQVTRAKKGDKGNFQGYLDLLFEVCQRVIQYDQRFNQLGVGWLLREMYAADSKRTVLFIENHYDSFIREGLRYAIEKMPSNQQKRLLNFKKYDTADLSNHDEANSEKQKETKQGIKKGKK